VHGAVRETYRAYLQDRVAAPQQSLKFFKVQGLGLGNKGLGLRV